VIGAHAPPPELVIVMALFLHSIHTDKVDLDIKEAPFFAINMNRTKFISVMFQTQTVDSLKGPLLL
jgi:hypothetical protein